MIDARKEINDRNARKIAEMLESPESRMILEAHMWFPFARGWDCKRFDETELQWAKRVMDAFRERVNRGEQ
jgi:hypothetical protein